MPPNQYSTPITSDADDLLKAGIAAAKAKQKEQARELLMQVLDVDEENAIAWLWLSSVMGTLEEQEICLENVLAIDPNHKAAQQGLAILRKKISGGQQISNKTEPSPPPQKESRPRSGTSRYNRISSGTMPTASKKSTKKRLSTRSYKAGSPPPAKKKSGTPDYLVNYTPSPYEASLDASDDILSNELACPYCAALTEAEDKRCKTCDKKLWISVPRNKTPSKLYNSIKAVQGGTLTFLFIATILLVGQGLEDGKPLTESLMAAIIPAPILIYLTVVQIGLLKRWKIIWFLYLVQSIFLLALFFIGGFLYGTRCFIVIALAQFFRVLTVGDDFTFDKYRVLLRSDRGVKTAMGFMGKGNYYFKRKMWAMAVVHYRQAAYRMSNNIKPQLGLIECYLKLNLYDKIDEPLAKAKSINKNDPTLKELIQIIEQN